MKLKFKKFLPIIFMIFIVVLIASCSQTQPQPATTATYKSEETSCDESTSLAGVFNETDNTLIIDGSKIRVLTDDIFKKEAKKIYSRGEIIEKVILTEGVEKIEKQTFFGYENLKFINFPASLSEIEERMFYDSQNLLRITVDSDNQHFVTDEKGVLFTKDMTELIVYPPAIPDKEYSIPETVTTIRSNAFYKCLNLKKLNMPSKLSGDFSHWFYCCDNLEEITLPADSKNYLCDKQGIIYSADTKEIVFVPSKLKTLEFPEGVNSFTYDPIINNSAVTEIIFSETTEEITGFLYRFPNLEKITVNEKNLKFSSFYGVLYNKDKTELIWYPPMKSDKEFTVPDTVNRINFIRSVFLESLTVSDSVKTIEDDAFWVCEGLKYVHIGSGLEKFDYNDEFSVKYENIFVMCKNLERITVDSNNKNFVIDEYGALCTADLTDIITLPSNGKTEEYVINDSVIRILNCFENCRNLRKLYIGESVEYINIGEADTETILGFSGCVSLEEITVSASNKNYTSENGVLYNKDKTKLCLYPANKACDGFVIPDSVECAGDFAFLDNRNIKKIYSSVKTDPNYIFNFMSYEENYRLDIDIYYAGTKKDWPYEYLKDNPKIHFEAKGLPEN